MALKRRSAFVAGAERGHERQHAAGAVAGERDPRGVAAERRAFRATWTSAA